MAQLVSVKNNELPETSFLIIRAEFVWENTRNYLNFLSFFYVETAHMVPFDNNKPLILYVHNIVLQPLNKISQGVSNHVIH